MHIYFSGIGGSGIGPLALIAHQAGYAVSGSDAVDSSYIDYLRKSGITDITIGQSREQVTKRNTDRPINWLVYSSAVEKENPNHPELVFARDNNIKMSKRDELIVNIMHLADLKMIAIAGTHGKTTTTAMIIWLFKQLDIPVSYSVGGKLSFGEMGEFDPLSDYFIYEADEYDRNFLHFSPQMSVIPGLAYDHPDIYPSQQEYNDAFKEFFAQSSYVTLWEQDANSLGIVVDDKHTVTSKDTDLSAINLVGEVNRRNAHVAITALVKLGICTYQAGLDAIQTFPGVSRRFEQITTNIYTDYAHTPEKIHGALQLAHEVAGDKVVVVYEGLHNMRQHFIRDKLVDLFDGIKKLYIAPSYLAREDEAQELLTAEDLCEITTKPNDREPVKLDENLKNSIIKHANTGDLVLCLTAGGSGSLDEWLRRELTK